jgi:hypothetical protein
VRQPECDILLIANADLQSQIRVISVLKSDKTRAVEAPTAYSSAGRRKKGKFRECLFVTNRKKATFREYRYLIVQISII